VNYEAALPALLGRSLADRTGKTVEVVTLAASGWNPYQYLAAVREELRQQAYGLGIVFLYIGNDVVDSTAAVVAPRQLGTARLLRLPRNGSGSEWRAALLRPANDFLEAKSHLFVLSKTGMSTMLARWGLTAAYFPEVFEKSFASSPLWPATVAACQRIHREFGRSRTPVLFVLLPCSYQVHAQVFERYVEAFGVDRGEVDLEQPNRILGQAFQQASLPLLDPLPGMRVEAAQDRLLFGEADRHLNAAGHEVVSRFVGEAAAPLIEGVPRHEPAIARGN
jgi:hypothetical protein